jgi:NADPH2:quinone reductase
MDMVRTVELAATGGPEVLRPVERKLPLPGPGEVRIRQTAAGVNFVDIYQRTGLYTLPALPAVLGVEGAGRVEAVGDGVTQWRPGDRVAYAGLPVGGYAEARNLPAGRLIRLPDSVPESIAAASLLRGLTAHMLLFRTAPLRAGATVLIHAAAGGLGLLLLQWARRLGARTIGTVSSPAKAACATGHGLDHVIVSRQQDFVAAVKDLTNGRGVDLAIDGIGGGTLARTLDCVRPFGTVASIGQAAGAIPPVDVEAIGPRRSLNFARPSVLAYASEPEAYAAAAAAFSAILADGLQIRIGAEFPLANAAQAHAALESGSTTGSVILRC